MQPAIWSTPNLFCLAKLDNDTGLRRPDQLISVYNMFREEDCTVKLAT